MMREDLLRKIRTCLRLAKSANPHEAATALRQAQKLMQQHGIELNEVGEVCEARAKTARRGRSLTDSIHWLMLMVAAAFKCRVICSVMPEGAHGIHAIFYGEGPAPTVAAYSFEVLRRQMDQACATHLKLVRVPEQRAVRGEAFRKGWVTAVRHLLPRTDIDTRERLALDSYESIRWPDLSTVDKKSIKGESPERDEVVGWLVGKSARLASGIEAAADSSAEPLQLELQP